MILSVSRRTDIPAFYSKWVMNRIREGFVYVRNPFNYNQVSRVPITSDNVDCIVFWTKDATEMLQYLDELNERKFKYYFQYTITPYKKDLEPFYDKKPQILDSFIKLSERIGKDKVIFRYDPIILTDFYTTNYHYKKFEIFCKKLHKHTDKIIISFLDGYKKVARNMKGIAIEEITESKMREIASTMANIAHKYNLMIETCAEKIDLSEYGVNHASCIDGNLIEKIIGGELALKRGNEFLADAQRESCGCIKCIDIGSYDTCIHQCLYCYANINKSKAVENYNKHNEKSPILYGEYSEDKVKEREPRDTRSFVKKQQTFFDG